MTGRTCGLSRSSGRTSRTVRGVRLVGDSAQAGDPVRVPVAGVEVEGHIKAVEASTLHVRIGRRLF
jgi:hypothetical protein